MWLSAANKERIRASKVEDVFNTVTATGNLGFDGRRQQTVAADDGQMDLAARPRTRRRHHLALENDDWTKDVRPELEAVLRDQGVMSCSQGEKVIAQLVGLRSGARGHRRKKHQPRHADSAKRNSLRDPQLYRQEDVPLACIVALQGGTRLHVWPFDTDKEEVVTLEEGEMLIFRGDLCHAGAAYSRKNTRIHAYLDLPDGRHRSEQTTFC